MTGDPDVQDIVGAPWRSAIYAIVPHPDDARILLFPSGNSYALPHIEVVEEILVHDIGRVTALVRTLFGADLLAYRSASFSVDRREHCVSGVFVVEPLPTRECAAVGGIWADASALATLPIVPEAHRDVILSYLAEIEHDHVPDQRPPWARPGWFREAEAWILAELASLAYSVTSPVEQVRSWAISCVLRVHTTAGTIYFKAAANLPLCTDEPALLDVLSRLFPDHIPAPLRVDHQRHWMLTHDWGAPVGWDAPVETCRAIYRTWGQIQAASSAQLDRLLAAGCLDRRLDVLASQIDPLLADELALSLLEEAERVALRRAAPRLKALCAELARYHIPYALLHGDLHPANVAAHGGRYLFFDLTDGSIAHPFFVLMYLFHADAQHAVALLDSCIEAWSGVAPVRHLKQAWSIAAPLCALHHTISYQHIIANLEPQARHELAWAMTFYGRKVLELLQS